MPDSGSTSFIPKHNSFRAERGGPVKHVFFGTIIIRVVFLATLLASAGVFFYERQVRGELMAEISRFQAEAGSFEVDTQRLTEIVAFDERLRQAEILREQSVSTRALLTALERSTIRSVQINSLELTREEAGEIELTADLNTDSFNSVIFQRSILNESAVLQAAQVRDVKVSFANETDGTNAGQNVGNEGVTFSASIIIDPAAIPALVETTVGAPTPTALPNDEESAEIFNQSAPTE